MALSSSIAILFVLCTTSGESRRTESNIHVVIQSLHAEHGVSGNTRANDTQDESHSLESNAAIRVQGHAQKAPTTSRVPFWLLLEEKCTRAAFDHDRGFETGQDKIYKGEFGLARNGVVPDDEAAEARVESHLSQKPCPAGGQEFVAVKCVWDKDVGASGMALQGFSGDEIEEAGGRLSKTGEAFGRKDIGAGFLHAMNAIGGGFIQVVQSKPEGRFVDAAALQAALAKASYYDFREVRKLVSLKYAEGTFMEAKPKGCCRGFYLNGYYGRHESWSKCYRDFIQNTGTNHWIPGGCNEEMLLVVSDEKQQPTGKLSYTEWEKRDKPMNVLNYWNGGTFSGPDVVRENHDMHGYLL